MQPTKRYVILLFSSIVISLAVIVPKVASIDTNDSGSTQFLPVVTANYSVAAAPNNPPYPPSTPKPAGGATGQALYIELSWEGGDPDGDAVTYDVYIESGDTTPDVPKSEDQSETTFSPGKLRPNLRFYWQIVATDEHGATAEGPVWDFITQQPDNMVQVPAGEFQMGCNQTMIEESCSSNELPLHPVYLDTFYIDKYEVTNAEYARCVRARVCSPPDSEESHTRPDYYTNSDFANYPVIHVSWYHADTYCSWAKKRLPTEAEWEKTARGSADTRVWPWGNQSPDCTRANYKDGPSTADYCIGDTTGVGSYPTGASPYGALDMAGNVSEWVSDWYKSTYYNESPYSNPTGPPTGEIKTKRGGKYNQRTIIMRVAQRQDDGFPNLNFSGQSTGFRCVLDPVE